MKQTRVPVTAADAYQRDRDKLRAENERLRRLLVFADGAAVTGLGMALADLYAEDCEWAQETLTRAGCHPRGSVQGPVREASDG